MKKLLLLLALTVALTTSASAAEWKFWQKCTKEVNENVVFDGSYCYSKCENAQETEIVDFLTKLNTMSNAHNLKAVRTYYSKDFKSTDGFDHTTFFKMVEETFKTYPDVSYKLNIKKIDVYGEWATAALYDEVTATLDPPEGTNATADKGELKGNCDYILYLKKEGAEWKIVSDYIVAEETTLKYGEAKKIPMTIESPLFVKNGEEYTVTLKMDCPKDIFTLASLERESITYPPAKPSETFRKFPQEGILERIVKANSVGRNEYSIASIGITRLFVGDDKATLGFQMSGMALLMRRVNNKE